MKTNPPHAHAGTPHLLIAVGVTLAQFVGLLAIVSLFAPLFRGPPDPATTEINVANYKAFLTSMGLLVSGLLFLLVYTQRALRHERELNRRAANDR